MFGPKRYRGGIPLLRDTSQGGRELIRTETQLCGGEFGAVFLKQTGFRRSVQSP